MVCRLVEAYSPERIYLFGSIAGGEAGPDSDCDIMVMVPDDAPPERLRSRLAYLVALDDALNALAARDERKARVV
ncbi:MAG: nucleotidyltransferase domain-containing protein [Bryobacteraceae bacterium]